MSRDKKTLYKVGIPGINIFMFTILLVICLEYWTGQFYNDKNVTDFYLIQLMVIFFISYADIVIKYGWLHLFSLLQFSTFVFMISSPLFSPLTNGESIRFAHTPEPTYFSEVVIQHVFLVFSAYIAAAHFFYFSSNLKMNVESAAPQTNNELYIIGKNTLLVFLPFSLLYSVFLLSTDRVEVFAGGMESASMPVYLRVTNLVYKVGFYIFVASCPPFKKFMKYTLLYFLSLFPILMYGERGQAFMVIMFIIWYVSRFYGKKINFIYVVSGAFVGIISSYLIILYRSQIELQTTNIITMLTLFFEDSSTTCKLTSFFEMYGSKVPHSYPFFLDQLISGPLSLFNGTASLGQSYDILSNRSSLGHNLVYYISPSYYLGGNSTGTAWVTECYEFGLVGVILGSYVLSLFIKFLNTRMMYNKYTLIFIYPLFNVLLLSPRGNLFISISEIFKVLVIFYCLKFTKKAFM